MRYAYIATIEQPSAETTTVGIQKNSTLRMALPRLAAKNSPNINIPTIQNLGERRPARSGASPVAFDPLRKGQAYANSAMNMAANPLRTPLTYSITLFQLSQHYARLRRRRSR